MSPFYYVIPTVANVVAYVTFLHVMPFPLSFFLSFFEMYFEHVKENRKPGHSDNNNNRLDDIDHHLFFMSEKEWGEVGLCTLI